MTSEEHLCNLCNKKFYNNTSLQIHNDYQHKNLMKMWMQNEEVSSEPELSANEYLGPLNSNGPCLNSYNDKAISPPMQSTSPPSEYGYKTGTGDKNSIGMVACGPNSSSSNASFQNTFESLIDYPLSQNGYGNYQQPSFQQLFSDEGMKAYANQRFQPYPIPRSSLPAMSPSVCIVPEVKEEPNGSPPHPAILDLDSQKFLTHSATSPTMTTVPITWRSHDSYQVQNNQMMGSVSSTTDMGPVGISASPVSVNGNAFNTSHLSNNYISHHSLMTHNQHVQRPAYSQGSSISTFYPQGMHANPTSAQYGPDQFSQTSTEDAPPQSEYASNVKRAKSYRCNECNKWFTSHGHLKRHYNTTLHKTMVKNGVGNTRSVSPAVKSSSQRKSLSPPTVATLDSVKIKQEPICPISPESCDVNGYQQSPVVFQHMSNPNSFGITSSCNPVVPVYSDASAQINTLPYSHIYPSEQAVPPPLYPGHFGTESTFPTMHNTVNSRHIFNMNPNYSYPAMINQPQINEYNQIPVEAFNSFRLDTVEKNVNNSISAVETTTPSPIQGETVSEASPDSNESCTSHIQPDNFRCEDCNKSFNKMCYLTQHRSVYHDGEKPFKCSTCGKRFTEEANFQEHQTKHAGDKPYKCEICPKQFNHKTDLRRHMCLHTGEKPFSCEVCGKGFIRKDHMLKHLTTHRKKQNNANNHNGNNVLSHTPAVGVPSGMIAPISIPSHPSSGMPNHIPSIMSNHPSPGLPNLTQVGLPHQSPVSVPANSPILNNSQFLSHHSSIPHPPHSSSGGHQIHVVAPPVY